MVLSQPQAVTAGVLAPASPRSSTCGFLSANEEWLLVPGLSHLPLSAWRKVARTRWRPASIFAEVLGLWPSDGASSPLE